MKIQFATTSTEGFLSSVGIGIDGIPFLARDLHWKGIDDRNNIVKKLVLFLREMKEAGLKVDGIERAETLLETLEKKRAAEKKVD